MKKLTPQQFKAVTLYRYLGGPRPSGIPHITKKDYPYVLTRWARFDAWNHWKDVGGPRPAGVWKQVPTWEPTLPWDPWKLRAAIVKARRPAVPGPTPNVPPVPPAPAWARGYQFPICLAGDIDDARRALLSPRVYQPFFSADPAYEAVLSIAMAFRDQGREPGVWYVPTQVSRVRAVQTANQIRTTKIVGQAENQPEFDQSYEDGMRFMWANLSALNETTLERFRRGECATGHEHYWNTNPDLVLDDKNVPVVCHLIAVYDAHAEQAAQGHPLPPGWNPQLADYVAAGRFHVGDGPYSAGMTASQYQALPVSR